MVHKAKGFAVIITVVCVTVACMFLMDNPVLNVALVRPPKHVVQPLNQQVFPIPTEEKTRKPSPLPRWKIKARGILRSQEEQHNEAIQILALAVESSLAKHSRKLSKYRSTCDWTDGSWVKDISIEYGKGILSGYGKCRVDHRQNCKRNKQDSPYLGYRWVLNNKTCETNRIPFTRQRFLETIRNKKVAFIGDSLTRNMFQSLACLLYVANNKSKMIEDGESRYSYPDFGASIQFIVSNYLVKETSKKCDSSATSKIAGKPCLDIYQVDSKWASRAKEFDILMFATGGWWEHDVQMRQASNGETNYRNSRKILNQSLRTVVDYLGRPEFKNKQLFWRCSEVSHFYGGEWNTGGTCRRDTPSNFTQYNAVSLFIQEAVIDSLIASSSTINLFDITRMSSYRQDAHPSSQSNIGGTTDCKHWCLPGVTDHWNEMWLNMLDKSATTK